MNFDLRKVILAVIIAVAVGLLCMFLGGPVLVSTAIPFLVAIGGFLTQFGWGIGILAGAWYYFSGGAVA